MKRILLVLTLILMVVLVACNKSSQTVTPQDSTVTVSFVVDERFVKDQADFAIPARTIKAGEALGELAIPSEAKVPDASLIYLNELVWCYDAEGKVEYDPDLPITEDCTLYLVQKGKRYSITYHYDPSLSFEGAFVKTYRYGDATPLPNVDLGYGYRSLGRWYYDDTSYYSVRIPADASGNLDLTFRADPIVYHLSYLSGLDGVEASALTNPNPTEWSIEDGKVLALRAASYEGKTCVGWRIRLTMGNSKSFEIDGKTVTYRHLQTVTKLDYAFIIWGQFSLEPIWDED